MTPLCLVLLGLGLFFGLILRDVLRMFCGGHSKAELRVGRGMITDLGSMPRWLSKSGALKTVITLDAGSRCGACDRPIVRPQDGYWYGRELLCERCMEKENLQAIRST